MSTKKFSLKYLQKKLKKEAIKNIETLESRLGMVKNKTKTKIETIERKEILGEQRIEKFN